MRLKGDVDSIRGNMVLMEKTVIESLRKENEVGEGMETTARTEDA